MNPTCWRFTTALIAVLELGPGLLRAEDQGTVVLEHLDSTVLRDNKIGIDPHRSVSVYLPPGYASSDRAYPVLYFCHGLNWSAEQVFADGNMQHLLERGFADGAVREFIMVAADYSSPTMGSLYENSPVSGRWLDFTVDELVPFIDRTFRTLPQSASRALTGDFIGGRGALKLAMTHADVFGTVYAMHPVATGTGRLPWMATDVNWKRIHEARTFAELAGPGRDQIFVMICQAFLPNPDRPPFYCDFFVEPAGGGGLRFDAEKSRRAQRGFLLDETLDEAAANLRSLRGLAFDWARYDSTEAHVYSNQAFTRKLDDLGIAHEAEEYNGNPWNRNWTENGRFRTRVLPFLERHLEFNQPRVAATAP